MNADLLERPGWRELVSTLRVERPGSEEQVLEERNHVGRRLDLVAEVEDLPGTDTICGATCMHITTFHVTATQTSHR